VVGKALAKQPEERYQHVDDFIVDLRAILRELPAEGGVRATAAAAVREIDPELVTTKTQAAPARASRLKAALDFITGKLRGRP
jgi:hypothetical protein